MILFTNLYENYTIASSNRFLISVKVWKRCNNQMIEYKKFHNARQWEFFHYRYSQHLHTKEQIIDHLFERKGRPTRLKRYFVERAIGCTRN